MTAMPRDRWLRAAGTAVLAAAALAGCTVSSEVISATPDDIVVKTAPFQEFSARSTAEKHCAQYGKTADFKGYYGNQYTIDRIMMVRCVAKEAAAK